MFSGSSIELSRLRPNLRLIAGLLRIPHWVKNTSILIPIIYFGQRLPYFPESLFAFISFSLASSVGYIVNDFRDRVSDSANPIKRKRPLAGDDISRRLLHYLFISTLISSLFFGFLVEIHFVYLIVLYLTLTTVYTFQLKNFLPVRIMVLPLFFILRLLAGFIIVDSSISFWFLGVSYLLLLGLSYLKSTIDAIDYSKTPSEWALRLRWNPADKLILLLYILVLFVMSSFLYNQLLSIENLVRPFFLFANVFFTILIFFLIYYYATFKRIMMEPLIICLTNPILVFVLALNVVIFWKTRF